MDVLAAADRFCLIRLMDLLQAHIIATYLQLPGDEEGNGSRVECAVAQRTLELLEPAEVSFERVFLRRKKVSGSKRSFFRKIW